MRAAENPFFRVIIRTVNVCFLASLFSCSSGVTGNSSTSESVLVVKSAGVVLGKLLGMTPNASAGGATISFLSSGGYFVSLDPSGNVVVGATYYSTSDCSGTAYAVASLNRPGFVIGSNVSGTTSLYSIPFDSASASQTIASYRPSASGSCTSYSYSGSFYALTANDSSITGISAASFSTPITVG